MSHPTLFYAPPGSTPVPINGNRWRDPETGDILFNPQPDPARHLLPLDWYVQEPDPRTSFGTPVYSINPDGDGVRMAWRADPKPIGPVFQQRVAELKALSAENAISLPAGFDAVSLQAALVHAVDALAGGTGPYSIPRDDGTWVSRTAAQLSAAMAGVSSRINTAAANAQAHYDALVALRDANDIIGLYEYDITTGWPS